MTIVLLYTPKDHHHHWRLRKSQGHVTELGWELSLDQKLISMSQVSIEVLRSERSNRKGKKRVKNGALAVKM